MSKDEVEQALAESRDMPLITDQLKSVVARIEEWEENEADKEWVRDLVNVVKQLGERIRDLEWRSCNQVQQWKEANKAWENGTWPKLDDQEA